MGTMKGCTLKPMLGEYNILAERDLYRVKFAVKRSLSFCGPMPITTPVIRLLQGSGIE
jgi:hypothetical protein